MMLILSLESEKEVNIFFPTIADVFLTFIIAGFVYQDLQTLW